MSGNNALLLEETRSKTDGFFIFVQFFQNFLKKFLHYSKQTSILSIAVA